MTLNELTARIVGWAQDRNLIEGSGPLQQCVKLGEELCAELFPAILNGDHKGIIDGHGDAYVVLTILAAQSGSSVLHPDAKNSGQVRQILEVYGQLCAAVARGKDVMPFVWELVYQLEGSARDEFGIDLGECVAAAWEEIKDRKGRMENGVFIKEGEKS